MAGNNSGTLGAYGTVLLGAEAIALGSTAIAAGTLGAAIAPLVGAAVLGGLALGGVYSTVTGKSMEDIYDDVFGDADKNQAEFLGITEDLFSELSDIGEDAKLEGKEITQMLGNLIARFSEAANSSSAAKKLTEDLDKLGVSYEKLKNKTQEEQITSTLAALQKSKGSSHIQVGKNLFDDNIVALLPFLQNADPLKKTAKKYEPDFYKRANKHRSKNDLVGDYFKSLNTPLETVKTLPLPGKPDTTKPDTTKPTTEPEFELDPELGKSLNIVAAGFKSLGSYIPDVVSGFDDLGEWFNDFEKEHLNKPQVETIPGAPPEPNYPPINEDLINKLNTKEVSLTQDNRMDVQINISQQPGESPEQVADRAIQNLKDEQKTREIEPPALFLTPDMYPWRP